MWALMVIQMVDDESCKAVKNVEKHANKMRSGWLCGNYYTECVWSVNCTTVIIVREK